AFESALEQLVEQFLFTRRAGHLQFSYGDLPSFVQTRIPSSRRAELHRRVFAAVVCRPISVQIGMHAFLGNLWDEALNIYTELLRKERKAGNHSDAIFCYQRARSCARKLSKALAAEDEIEI